MAHPLVLQLHFCRSEFKRAMAGVTEAEGLRRLEPMNSLGWMVGHMAWQEQLYWLTRAQGRVLVPELNDLVANGAPASTPPMSEMWAAWEVIIKESQPWLDQLTTPELSADMIINGKPHWESIGSMLRRVAYHYFYHIGESQAVRQLMGHQDVGDFVGSIGQEAPYIPE